jgi:hypothetical protein
MPITFVPDPTSKIAKKCPTCGQEAPLLIRSDAMRKLFAAGTPIQEIAELYGIPYHRVWRAVNPPRRPAGQPGSKIRTELTVARAKTLTKRQLTAISNTRSRIKNAVGKSIDNPSYRARDVEIAIEELERRGVRFD